MFINIYNNNDNHLHPTLVYYLNQVNTFWSFNQNVSTSQTHYLYDGIQLWYLIAITFKS